MIPIWAKDKTGKYRLFPYHLLDLTFSDGRPRVRYNTLTVYDWFKFEEDWGHLFEGDLDNGALVLRGQYQKQVKTE